MDSFNRQNERRDETVESGWGLSAFPESGEVPSAMAIASLARSRRRKQRRRVASLSACVVLVACALNVTRFEQEEREEVGIETMPSPVATQPMIARAAPRVQEPISVYARVRAEVPVFATDPVTGRYVPVGWVETRDVVPVETNSLSSTEVDQLRFLLANKQLLDGC